MTTVHTLHKNMVLGIQFLDFRWSTCTCGYLTYLEIYKGKKSMYVNIHVYLHVYLNRSLNVHSTLVIIRHEKESRHEEQTLTHTYMYYTLHVLYSTCTYYVLGTW